MEPEPPLPLAAWFSPLTREFRVLFDRQLRNDPALNAPNWRATSGLASWFVGLNVAARGSTVFGVMQPTIMGPASGTLSYEPPPLDLLGRAGGVAAAFNIPWTLP